MIYIHKDNQVPVEWEVLKGATNVREDFSRAELRVFMVGPTNRYYVPVTSADDGVIKFSTFPDVPEGAYSVEAAWYKNDRPYPFDKHGRFSHNVRRETLMRSRVDFVYAITEHQEEATELAQGAKIKIKSHVASYGYDGMDAWVTALFYGETANEVEWIEAYIGRLSAIQEAIRNAIEAKERLLELIDGVDFNDFVKKTGLKTINGHSLIGDGDITLNGDSNGSGIDLSAYLTKDHANNTFAKKTDIPSVSGLATQASVNGVNNKFGNVSSLQFDQTDNTITINGVKFDLVRHSDSPTPSGPTEPEYDYYVGQVDGSKSVFAAMTANDLVSNSTKQTSSLVNTTRVNKWIYFFMIPSGYNFAWLKYIDGGIKTTITDLADFTATHDDVTIGGKAYKVYGYRISPNDLDYKLALTK